jgi:phage shock protein A
MTRSLDFQLKTALAEIAQLKEKKTKLKAEVIAALEEGDNFEYALKNLEKKVKYGNNTVAAMAKIDQLERERADLMAKNYTLTMNAAKDNVCMRQMQERLAMFEQKDQEAMIQERAYPMSSHDDTLRLLSKNVK